MEQQNLFVSENISRIEEEIVKFHKKVILTNGFIKKTNKTPPAEKERAKRYRAEYLGRKENLS